MLQNSHTLDLDLLVISVGVSRLLSMLVGSGMMVAFGFRIFQYTVGFIDDLSCYFRSPKIERTQDSFSFH